MMSMPANNKPWEEQLNDNQWLNVINDREYNIQHAQIFMQCLKLAVDFHAVALIFSV